MSEERRAELLRELEGLQGTDDQEMNMWCSLTRAEYRALLAQALTIQADAREGVSGAPV